MQCVVDSELVLFQRFWIQEEIVYQPQVSFTPEESQCENHFLMSHSRDINGRFVVRLPLKQNLSDFGNSRALTFKYLLLMKNQFRLNSLKASYIDFLREYQELDHMRLISSPDQSQRREFFLPHHGVVRETSSTSRRI